MDILEIQQILVDITRRISEIQVMIRPDVDAKLQEMVEKITPKTVGKSTQIIIEEAERAQTVVDLTPALGDEDARWYVYEYMPNRTEISVGGERRATQLRAIM